MLTICEQIRALEDNDRLGTTTVSKYVEINLREDIDKTEAYINSKHISGDKDSMGRDKPFFNIVTSARNIWFRATDIDRKNIVIRGTKEKDEIPAFLATIKLQEWMKKSLFGHFLNDWGLNLATHGSSIVKFIEKDGELSAQVMDWNNMLVDAVDFENNIKVEKLWFTPAQLRKQKGYDQNFVKELLESTASRTTIDGQTKDNKADYIPVYEVHGELPLSLLTDKEEDEETYVQQMHVVCFQKSKENGEFDDYTLYSGKEAKDPYMLTHLLKKDGQTYSGGAVKNLFEAQWMVNHSQKQIKDQLDLASKIIFQTSDGNFVGQNVMSSIENGQILNHKQGEPLTMLNNKPDIGAMQSFKADWQNIASQINGISEAMQGQNAPSGTAWRQVQALLQESHSLFELMTENKGLYIIDMMTEYVIPYFKKQLNNSDEISMVLEDYQIQQIDAKYLPNEVIRRLNEKKKAVILSGEVYDPTQEAGDTTTIEEAIKGNLNGTQRFIKPSDVESVTWRELFKDLEWKLDIDVTGEAKDTQGALATLSTVLQTVSANPMVLQDPNVKMIFNKILGLTGTVSPLELSTVQAQPQMPTMPQGMPQMAPQPIQ